MSMDCPRCHTPNPANASHCKLCDTPLEIDPATMADAREQGGADGHQTPKNWSQAVTPPSAGSEMSGGQFNSGTLLAGRYEILDRLGGGGMGTVYKARDREVDRVVALKVIRAEMAGDAEILSRFKQELILARKVTHKNVIRIFDLGRAGGVRFITMEYIDGQDLRALVKKEGKPTPQRCVEIIQQVCLALEAAHAEKVVHRDLKPPNIMLDAQGKVYVMDFGIARSVGSEGLTMTGAMVGTPDYMSPEQVKGEDVDERADIFALGIIFYELLTEKMPVRAETAQRSMYKRTVERAISPATEDPRVPTFLSEVVSKCLEIDPAKRYQSAHDLWADLESWRIGLAEQTGRVVGRRLQGWLANRKMQIAAGILVLILAGGIAVRKWGSVAPAVKSENVSVVPTKSLAIFPFRNASGDHKLDWLGSGLGVMLTDDIGQSASLRTVSQARVGEVAHDLKIDPEAELDSTTLEQLADFANADVIVWGTYVKFGDQLRIDAKLLDRKQGTQASMRAEAANEKEVFKTVDNLAKQIRQNLALSSSAIEELQSTAFEPSSTSVKALQAYDQGLQLQQAGKNSEALKAFKISTESDPEFALAYSKLAETYEKAGQDDQAQATSLKAVDLSQKLPKQEKYLIGAAHAKILKEFAKAIEAYGTLAKASPGDADVSYELARLYEESGDLDKARTYYQKVHELDPKRLEVMNAQGRVELEANNWQKGLGFLTTALNLAIELNNEEQKADILRSIGVGYERLQRTDDALRSYEQSLEITRRLGMKAGTASSLHAIANVYDSTGKPELALKNYNESMAIRREIGDKSGIADVLTDMGSFQDDHGKPDLALNLYTKALQIQTDLGNEERRGLLLNNIGSIYSKKGEYGQAQTYYEQALQLRQKFNVPTDVAETLHNLGETAQNQGQFEQALAKYHQALDLRRKAGDKQMTAFETAAMGTVFGFQGRYGASLSSQEDAVKAYRALGDRSVLMASLLGEYGEALAQVGKKEEAAASLKEGLALASELKDQDGIARIQGYQGDNAFFSGDLKGARQFYGQAMQTAAQSADPRLVLTCKFNLAKLGVSEGNPKAVLPILKSVADDANRLGLKVLASQSSIYASEALIQMKRYEEARTILQSVLLLADKLGSLSLKAQGHALMARAWQMEGKTAEAAREKGVADELFSNIGAEGHFSAKARYDFASAAR
jgi:tetratricopeptide (TPR) repeat protein/predicted Ser/Thr protein kinase